MQKSFKHFFFEVFAVIALQISSRVSPDILTGVLPKMALETLPHILPGIFEMMSPEIFSRKFLQKLF